MLKKSDKRFYMRVGNVVMNLHWKRLTFKVVISMPTVVFLTTLTNLTVFLATLGFIRTQEESGFILAFFCKYLKKNTRIDLFKQNVIGVKTFLILILLKPDSQS